MSNYILGMHEQGAESHFIHPGPIVTTHELGLGTFGSTTVDFTDLVAKGFYFIARLNHGYGSKGTIPLRQYYGIFAATVASFVKFSKGCSRWIIGNEMNCARERPSGTIITPENYIDCYRRCRDAIHELSGHEHDEVLVGAVGPWNDESGPWLEYFSRIINIQLDGITLHTYTHGSNVYLITSEQKMNPPYQNCHYEFRAYRDFMNLIVDKSLPVYITEADQNGSWIATGWIEAACNEITRWNLTPGNQQIRALIMYRWPKYDEYYIEGKTDVIADFEAAGKNAQEWREEMATTLENTSFQGSWVEQDGISPLKVFVPWKVWWKERVNTDPVGTNFRPEAGPIADAGRFRSAPTAQKIWTNSSTHTAGLYQGPISVPAGSWATFKIYVKQATGTPAGDGMVKIGIDPTGGASPWSAKIVWSNDLWMPYADFVRIEVSAQSQGSITVFTRAEWKWASPWCDTYWDDAELVVSGAPVPVPGITQNLKVLLNDVIVFEQNFSSGIPADKIALLTLTKQNLDSAVTNLDAALS